MAHWSKQRMCSLCATQSCIKYAAYFCVLLPSVPAWWARTHFLWHFPSEHPAHHCNPSPGNTAASPWWPSLCSSAGCLVRGCPAKQSILYLIDIWVRVCNSVVEVVHTYLPVAAKWQVYGQAEQVVNKVLKGCEEMLHLLLRNPESQQHPHRHGKRQTLALPVESASGLDPKMNFDFHSEQPGPPAYL